MISNLPRLPKYMAMYYKETPNGTVSYKTVTCDFLSELTFFHETMIQMGYTPHSGFKLDEDRRIYERMDK